jgi:hypothetical protein
LIRGYEILDVQLLLDAEEELLAIFDLLYGAFQVESPEIEVRVPSVPVRVAEDGDRAHIESPWGEASCAKEDAIVLLMFLMQNHLLRSVRNFFAVHAACLEVSGKGVILTGTSTAGKSTLAAGLLGRGWTVYSDEIAALHRTDCRVHAYPRAMALRPATLELVRLPANCTVTELALADELKAVVQTFGPDDRAPGMSAPASVIAFLVPPREEEGENSGQEALEVFAPEFAEEFYGALSGLEGVIRVEPIEGNFYPGIRIFHRSGILISAAVDEAAARTNTFLAAHHRGARAPIDYEISPRCIELPARAGIEMLLGSILNMRVLMAKEGPAKMMFELSRALEGVRFYEIVPGRLNETAELVESLV